MSRVALLAAGGTGGHLFPATALAEVLRERGWLAHLVTDRRGARHVDPTDDLPCTVLPAAGIAGRGLWLRVAALPILGVGAVRAVSLMRRRRPAVVVGFGGYASVPAGLAARVRQVPLILHEANAVLGRANRLLASKAHLLATTFRSVARIPAELRPHQVGLPVRAEFEELATTDYEPPGPGDAVRLVVTGGSQGARALGIIVPAALAATDAATRRRLEVLQQARREMVDAVRAAYRDAGIRATVVPFIDDMAGALRRAHLVVGRAGAATVTENSVAGRPAIYIPLPSSIDGHQAANARAAVAAGAAWVVEEAAGAEATAQLMARLLVAPGCLAGAAANARSVVPAGAARRLADLVEGAAEGGAR